MIAGTSSQFSSARNGQAGWQQRVAMMKEKTVVREVYLNKELCTGFSEIGSTSFRVEFRTSPDGGRDSRSLNGRRKRGDIARKDQKKGNLNI